jgi:hypothetical protein
MRLFRRSIESSIKDLDDKIENYFATSRKYRSTVRQGSIVLLDKGNGMYDFLSFLVDRCGLEIGLIHLKDASSAKRAIQNAGVENIKAVIIESDMIDESANGNSLPSWLEREHCKIPIWVFNCGKSTINWIQTHTHRVGIFTPSKKLTEVIEDLGFPQECHLLASAYEECIC